MDAPTSRLLGSSRTTGAPITLWTLRNASMSVDVCSLGASVTAVRLPASGNAPTSNVSPCHQTLVALQSASLEENPCMGATCGRVCNRTRDASFILDGVTYRLAANDGPHHLHGGVVGWHQCVWQHAGSGATATAAWVALELQSPAGDEGYPGAVRARCLVSLSASNAVGIEYSATTDAPTVCALTNHCYWALGGHSDARGILDHTLTLHADDFVL